PSPSATHTLSLHDALPILSALQGVSAVEIRVPRGRPVRDVIRAQRRRLVTETAADDLFHFALMQVYARTEHGQNVRSKVQSLKRSEERRVGKEGIHMG